MLIASFGLYISGRLESLGMRRMSQWPVAVLNCLLCALAILGVGSLTAQSSPPSMEVNATEPPVTVPRGKRGTGDTRRFVWDWLDQHRAKHDKPPRG